MHDPRAGAGGGDFSRPARRFPENPSQFFAYDAIILSNVSRDVLCDEHLAWIDEWVGRRGGGLCMVGGAQQLCLRPLERDFRRPDASGGACPRRPRLGRGAGERPRDSPRRSPPDMASFVGSSRRIARRSRHCPAFQGSNRFGRVKPGAEVLAQTIRSERRANPEPAVVVQPFGRGRTMAMATAITRRWAGEFTQSWGGNDARYYKKFWRNVIYWLTENSSIGRRRLLAETDKRLYRPGEPMLFAPAPSTKTRRRLSTTVWP